MGEVLEDGRPDVEGRRRRSDYEPIVAGTVFRAIACHNPHAIRIALGLKTIETRIWETDYRGEILVCSTARPKIYPNGYALCVAELVDCRRMVKADEAAAWVGLYDAWAWVLEDVRPITPFRVTGYQKFFPITVPAGICCLPHFATSHQAELFGSVGGHDDPHPPAAVVRRPA